MTVLRSLGRGVALGAPWLLLLACPLLMLVWVFGLTGQPPASIVPVMTTGLFSVGLYTGAMMLVALLGLVARLLGGWRWLRVPAFALSAMLLFLLVQAACFVAALFLF